VPDPMYEAFALRLAGYSRLIQVSGVVRESGYTKQRGGIESR